MAPGTPMHFVGAVEVAAGLLVLTRWTRYGAYAACGWPVAIAGNLVLSGFFDVAVRDLAMAVDAFTLARFAKVEEDATGPQASCEEAHSVA